MDPLDRRANEAFPGRVVRKDLVRQVKVGANVPVYVLEFLIGKYCASDDPFTVEAGLVAVNQTLTDNFIRPDESEKTKARLKQRGRLRLIDKVDVRLVSSEDKFWAHLQSFNDKFVHIAEDVVYRYDRLVQGGAWCQVELIYDADDDDAPKRPFFIQALKPIQMAAFELSEYVEGRGHFNRDQWLDLVVRTLGLEADEYDLRGKLLATCRLIPMAERNYNLIELGPWGTGKSYVYRESNPNAILISGGKVTVAQLFVNNSTGRIGLLGSWDVVTFDEVAGLQMSESAVVNMLKDYMESGSFARGKEETPAEASVVLIGNTRRPHADLVSSAHLFADLPPSMIDPAFLDRLHFYLPGWEAPKVESRLFTDHFGFVSDYFAEALRQLRKRSHVSALDEEFALGAHLSARDERAVRKTVSGLLKILHPHGEWSRSELRQYLELAMEGRRRVKEQLKKLAPHDYAKVGFSYIERDTGHEYWVAVPEQPDDVSTAVVVPVEVASSTVPEPVSRSTADLLAEGESARVEFRWSARIDPRTRQADPVIEQMVVRTLAGFMNADGGILLIGVSDAAEVTGIEADCWTFEENPDSAGFALWLNRVLDTMIGPSAASNVSLAFEPLGDGTVCRADVRGGMGPAFVRSGKGDAALYVRLGNSTRLLNTAEALEYVSKHWRP